MPDIEGGARLRRGGQPHREDRLRAGHAGGGDRSPVGVDQLPDDREPEAAASGASAAGPLRTPETVEHLGQVLGLDTAAGVGDLDHDVVPRAVGGEGDRAARRGVPYRPGHQVAQGTENSFSSLFIGLAGVALLVGGIGVANTMLISVLERRREIGLRRALGASRGQIRGQFLTESVALSGLGGLGGLVGTLLGVLATIGYATYQGWPPVVPLVSVAGGCFGALVVGMAAGVYPSVRASRLTPTEALSAT